PAGRYAKAWLETQGVWRSVSEKVLPAVDVRAALAAVEAGAAEAGIVYRTDVAHSTKARIVFAVPVSEGPKIVYPVAAIAEREHESVARAYIEFLESDDARAIWQREGFTFPELAQSSR
ncbi:MAG TPA: molybdate ABC transporter substrate-binding protein, partial [Planctomycetota bacterium]|nr:molybdate ABC transporter substrate-binding protein [Planctomycetota bacterium]